MACIFSAYYVFEWALVHFNMLSGTHPIMIQNSIIYKNMNTQRIHCSDLQSGKAEHA